MIWFTQLPLSILLIFVHAKIQNEMNGVLCHDSALERLYWAGDNLR